MSRISDKYDVPFAVLVCGMERNKHEPIHLYIFYQKTLSSGSHLSQLSFNILIFIRSFVISNLISKINRGDDIDQRYRRQE
jgi:hypothetical protein